MQEKEIRLALVCFGGVSLAIYMHGVTKEIIKLARASKSFHSHNDLEDRLGATYTDGARDGITDTIDTETLYFEILQALGGDLSLKVITDVIAGASAGGMNAVFLGRALAHDLNYDHLTTLWLEEADVSRLIGETTPASRWEKFVTRPLITVLSNKYLQQSRLRDSVKEKLPSLLSLRHLNPPFDGKHVMKLAYDGLTHMGRDDPAHSLLPSGHRLDLFVTVTDYYGFLRQIPIHDPPMIEEREHRHNLNFSYYAASGQSTSDFATNGSHSDFSHDHIPGLSFAARATSSIPGAFPPVQIREVDEVMASLGHHWTTRDKFIQDNFQPHLQSGSNPELTSFLDGSILNNKPFDQAIKAIMDRPAYREVNRLLIYIEPNPKDRPPPPSGKSPGVWATIRGAITDLPLNEPIYDDMAEVQALNQRVRTIKAVIESIKPRVSSMVTEISPARNGKISVEDISRWREMANARATREAGFSYEAYARLKIRTVVSYLTRLLCQLDIPPQQKRTLFSALHVWVYRDGMSQENLYNGLPGPSTSSENLLNWAKNILHNPAESPLPSWAEFLQQFDILFLRRRVHFLIQELNNHYGRGRGDTGRLDRLKTALYQQLAQMDGCEDINNLDESSRAHIQTALNYTLSFPFDDTDDANTPHFSRVKSTMEGALKKLAGQFHLETYSRATDLLMANLYSDDWDPATRDSLLTSYLGFSFWDVITFAIMGSRDQGEFNEISINRISPKDSCLTHAAGGGPLKGVAMKSFGAFFNKRDRENDYLWGRLNGAERLIDILAAEAKEAGLDYRLNIMALKKKAFGLILETEEIQMGYSDNLINNLRARIENL